MGRRPAEALHLALSLIGAVLYFVFVLPRWWVLLGGFDNTLATAGRIAAGVPIGLAAIPVVLFLQQSLKPEHRTPEIALRLRAWSGVLHVVAGALIVVAAIAEIWVHLQAAGPWLFAVYGAAGAIAILGMLAFYLSFVAEKPPREPKQPKPVKPAKEKKPRGKRKRTETAATESSGTETSAAEDVTPETSEDAAESAVTQTADESAVPDEEPASTGGLRNKRPTGKSRKGVQR